MNQKIFHLRHLSFNNSQKVCSAAWRNNFYKSCSRSFSAFVKLSKDKCVPNYYKLKYLPVHSTRLFHTTHNQSQRTDLYKVLGVSKNASQSEIKKAYYQLAKKYHPDTNKDEAGAAKKFQEVSSAYEVLGDDSKRKEYDNWGAQTPFGDQHGASANEFKYHSTIDPEELFRRIFGDFQNFKPRMSDFEYTDTNFGFGAAEQVVIDLDFHEAARGCLKIAKVNVVDVCPTCKGTCVTPGTKMVRCDHCNATGMETMSTGPFIMKTTCRKCHGTGMFNRYPCNDCVGKGSSVQQRGVQINIPPGVEDGQTVRVKTGMSEIFVTFRLRESKYFRRDGSDLHTDAAISLSQAVLGGEIKIQGLYNDITVQIPSGTSSHKVFRFPGKGIKKGTGYGNGDHYVHIKIAIPTKLDSVKYDLIKAYAELETDTPGSISGMSSKSSKSEYSAHEKNEKKGLLEKIKSAIFG